MSSKSNDLREYVRFRILRLLRDNPELSQRDLARLLGVSTGGIHYALRALIDKGMVKIGSFSTSPDKRRYTYMLTPRGLAEKAALAGRFLHRKLCEHEALVAEIEALRAELADSDAQELRTSGLSSPTLAVWARLSPANLPAVRYIISRLSPETITDGFSLMTVVPLPLDVSKAP